MKKVINVTIAQYVFAVEEDAHALLEEYLESIRAAYQQNEDFAEIQQDIELAIAEKFTALGKGSQVAVSLADVTAVREELGEAADFEDGRTTDSDESEQSQSASTAESSEYRPVRRLYRDTDEAFVGGVAAGIAHYIQIDPVIIRLAFVLSVLFSGIGIFIYIILWMIIPAAKTTPQKYEMYGERMTLDTLTEHVKKKLQDLEKNELPRVKNVMRTSSAKIESKLSQSSQHFASNTNKVLKRVVQVVLVVIACIVIAGISAGIVLLVS